MAESQSFATHRKFVPFYHFVTAAILLVHLGWRVWGLFGGLTFTAVMDVLVAVALISLFYYARTFPLAVQDRLIRLEERLRLARLLPAEQQPRIEELSARQMVGLRFASDEEVPGLVTRILAGELTGGEEIKKQIKTWRPDHTRC